MSLITRVRIHNLVRWPVIGTASTGEPVWGPPEDVPCRWDDSLREVIQPDNTRHMSRVQLITAIPLTIGDLVLRGTVATTAFWADPKKNPGTHEVFMTEQTDNIRGTETLYEAYA